MIGGSDERHRALGGDLMRIIVAQTWQSRPLRWVLEAPNAENSSGCGMETWSAVCCGSTGKLKTEIPVKMVKEVATASAEDERNSKRNSPCESGGVSLWRRMINASCGRRTPFGQPCEDLANNRGNGTAASDWGAAWVKADILNGEQTTVSWRRL